MTPAIFLSQIQRREPEPVYLFLGAEPYRRALCRRALAERVLGTGDRDQGLADWDLQETTLSVVVDDACSLSLFAPRRLLWVSHAEAALPRGRAGAEAGEVDAVAGGALAPLSRYLERPSPGVVVVLEASRYELEGEDKSKADRVRKFYSAIPAQVEFPSYSVQEARQLAVELSRAAGLAMDGDAIEWMVDLLGADAMHIATEIEKLRLYAGDRKRIDARELATLVPDSSVSTIFVLVDALGKRDRLRALGLVDTLVRQGEYMPLALGFLASLFRLALAAKEKGLKSPQQIQHEFSKPGRPVWRSKAEQIHQTAAVFSKAQLETGLRQIFATDWALREARPSDRIVMEKFILALAG
jgi:DNA polymerase-3 subunit delta